MGCGSSKPAQVSPTNEAVPPPTQAAVPAATQAAAAPEQAAAAAAPAPAAPEQTPTPAAAPEQAAAAAEEEEKEEKAAPQAKSPNTRKSSKAPEPELSRSSSDDSRLNADDATMRAAGLGAKYKDVKLQWAFRPLIFVGVSGSGKRTIARMFVKANPEQFGFSVSHTCREMRPGEIDGVDYHFVSKPIMDAMINEGKFMQVTEAFGSVYATSFSAVQAVAHAGQMCVMALEIEGALALKKNEEFMALRPRFILIKPPNMRSLAERLRKRGDNEDRVAQLMKRAGQPTSMSNVDLRTQQAPEKGSQEDGEFRYGAEEEETDFFDAVVINKDVTESYKILKDILAGDFGLKSTMTASRASLSAAVVED